MNLLAIKALAALALVVGIFGAGWKLGSEHTQAQWDREKAELNAKAVEELAAAQQHTRDVEADMQERLRKTTAAYTQKLKEKNDEENAAVERARTDGLFVNAECPSNPNTVSSAASSTGGSHAATRVRLHEKDGEFLIRLASEADRTAEQLTACQTILNEERHD